MKNLMYLLVVFLLAFNFSCKSNGTDPEEKKSVRDYTWTTDTLAYEGSSQTLMRSIWGSSASDIYVCGHNDRSRGNLWHYTGYKWIDVDIFKTVASTPNSLNGVHGTSRNDVWVVGAKVNYNPNPPPTLVETSFIIYYNGIQWAEHKVNTNSSVSNVYANAPDDVWACGADGIVYHYDGSGWDLDTIKINKAAEDYFQLNNMIKYNGKLYCFGRNSAEQGAKLIYYFFEKISGEWAKKDSFIIEGMNLENKWGSTGFYISDINKLYSHGYGGVFEYIEPGWNNIFRTDYAITDMKGEENNFVLSGDFGHVFHYNGKDWKELENLYREDMVYTGVWMDEDEVFISGTDLSGYPQTTVIWHGK